MNNKEMVICSHPEHSSVLEVMTEKEFLKMKEIDPSYEILFFTPTREEAIESVRSTLSKLALQEGDWSTVKARLKEWYEKE